MILVDTSVWASHLAQADVRLTALLEDGQVLMHPFILGEISLGNLPKREAVLLILGSVPEASIASTDEAQRFIERHKIAGSGVGYVDVHLVASCLIDSVALWTRDKRLRAVADRLGVAADLD